MSMKTSDDKTKIETYSTSDHAKTYRALAPGPNRNTAEIQSDFETLMQDGFVIIRDLITSDEIDIIKQEASQLLGRAGRNPFEGLQTQRVYNVLSKTRCTDLMGEHPRVLGVLDRLFQPNYLLSQSQIINIQPSEAAQTLHFDDGFYRIPRPRPPLGAATIWAIDDFTEENGATVIIPGSHKWGEDGKPERSQTLPAVMPAGSVVIFLGTTWHGGGENRTERPRLAVTHQYCEGYLRQQENYLLELSRETVRGLSPQLQALVGYSVHPPFMGMVNGQHPLRLIDED